LRVDYRNSIIDTYLSRPTGLQASARRIQLTSVGVFLPGTLL